MPETEEEDWKPPEEFLDLHKELGIDNPEKYCRYPSGFSISKTVLYRHGDPENWPDSVEKVSLDTERNTARYWILRPSRNCLDVIEAEPDLETALIHDPNNPGSRHIDGVHGIWLYHRGDTFYRSFDGADPYFVPAPKPEITENWSTVKQALQGEFQS